MIDDRLTDRATEALRRCDLLAAVSDEPGRITRTYLSPAAKIVHAIVAEWMREAGLTVRVDAVGNLIGRRPAANPDAPVFLIGSHLDTVPNAGRYDGILGVLLGLAAIETLDGVDLPFAVDVVGFSEEEGVRFRTSYLGSKAVCGCFDAPCLTRTDVAGVTLADAIRTFELDPDRIADAAYAPGHLLGYLEAHIEQGPILEAMNQSLGIVDAIVGQSRLWLDFQGRAGHAGTQPMTRRRDALAAAAEFIGRVERLAHETDGLRATVGCISASPGAVNVVPGSARLSLDVRHAGDDRRLAAVDALLHEANDIARRRGVALSVERAEDHDAVPMDPLLTSLLAESAAARGQAAPILSSGAGHDAAVLARHTRAAMLFLRSVGGISHHPDEAVEPADVQAALAVMVDFLTRLSSRQLPPETP